MHCGCKWHMASLFGAAERSLKAESPRIGVHEWQKGETVCLYCGVLCWAGLAGSCLVTLSVHHLPQGQAPDGSYHTTAHWHGTRCSAAAVSQFFIHWLLRAVFFFPTAEHLDADQWSRAYKSPDLSAKPLLLFPCELCIHTDAAFQRFLILFSLKWLNTHFSASRRGKYISFISVLCWPRLSSVWVHRVSFACYPAA